MDKVSSLTCDHEAIRKGSVKAKLFHFRVFLHNIVSFRMAVDRHTLKTGATPDIKVST
jgi:hypothetical protein